MDTEDFNLGRWKTSKQILKSHSGHCDGADCDHDACEDDTDDWDDDWDVSGNAASDKDPAEPLYHRPSLPCCVLCIRQRTLRCLS